MAGTTPTPRAGADPKDPPADLAADNARLEAEVAELRGQLDDATRQLLHWRAAAVRSWADALSTGGSRILEAELASVRQELDLLHGTLSWRVTAPLRAARNIQRSLTGRG